MADYTIVAQATSNSSPNTVDELIEISGAAGTGFFLKRVEISCQSPNSDVDITGTIIRLTTVGGTGAAYTPKQKRTTSPVATSTVKIKNGTTNFSYGTTGNSLWQTDVNGRAVWAWIPRGNEEYIDSGAAGIVAISVAVSGASQVINVNAEIEE